MSIRNRQVLAALGTIAAVGGVVGAAGLTFDGHFEVLSVVFTLPFAVAAFVGSFLARRYSTVFLLGAAVGRYLVETRTAYGLASMFLALTAAAIAAAIVLATLRNARAVALAVGGLVAAPIVLYMISIATFAVRGA